MFSKAKKTVLNEGQASLSKYSFIIALGLGIIIFLPFIIQDKGLFVFYGDYNSQQIPFYQLAHKAVRSGDVYWNWYTDLGSNFLGSYSFYLLFSPFFWLTLPFPNHIVPYLIAPLLILKTACAALTAYYYLERFVKDRRNAVIGSLLYSFSGWMFYNIFYNHFHEVLIFFPLLLIGVEKLVTENKKVFFAIVFAINAIVNYWFFVGEVVFVIIYIFVRWYSGGWHGINLKKFISIGFEALLGILLSAVVILPSIGAIIGNPRAGVENLLDGWGLISYWHDFAEQGDFPQRILAIISAFFFPPEHPAYTNIFPNHGASWSSIAGWLPMFSFVGVIAYFVQNRGKSSWIKKTIVLLFVMSAIPLFNALFTALNRAYYARWFYMLTLLTALATTLALDNIKDTSAQNGFKDGIKWTFVITTIAALLVGLSPTIYSDKVTVGLVPSQIRLWVWYGFVVLGLIIIAVLLLKFSDKKKLQKYMAISLAVYTSVFGVTYLFSARDLFPRTDLISGVALANRGEFDLPESPFARSDIYDDMDNMLMYWEQPNIQAFHSVVSPSIMEFYDSLGIERSEGSRPPVEDFPLRSLLSVRWLFIAEENENQQPMPYYMYYDTQNGYNIYENLGYIPMGFAYEKQISEDHFTALPENMRTNALINAILINDSPDEYSDILPYLSLDETQKISYDYYMDYYTAKNVSSVRDFATNNKGFSATANYDVDKLVFFSVPYDKGWSANVNGTSSKIIKVNNGFMAVIVPAGENNISFFYFPPYLKLGAIISLSAILILGLYFLLSRITQKKQKKYIQKQRSGLDAYTLSWEEYLSRHDDKSQKNSVPDRFKEEKQEEILRQYLSIEAANDDVEGDK